MIWQPATRCPSKTCNRFRSKLWVKANLSKGNNLNHKLNRKTHSTVQTRDRCIQIASRNLHSRQKLEFLHQIHTRRTKMRGSQFHTFVVWSTAIFSLSLTGMVSTGERFQVIWNKDFHSSSKLNSVSCSRNTMSNFRRTKLMKHSIQMKSVLLSTMHSWAATKNYSMATWTSGSQDQPACRWWRSARSFSVWTWEILGVLLLNFLVAINLSLKPLVGIRNQVSTTKPQESSTAEAGSIPSEIQIRTQSALLECG